MRKKLSSQALFVPFGGRSTGERLAKQWLHLLRETSARNDFNQPDQLPFNALEALQFPILGYYGGNSRCMPTCNKLHKIWPQCLVKIMPDVGHFLPAIYPQEVADTLSSFLMEPTSRQFDSPIRKPAASAQGELTRRPLQMLEEEASI